MPPQQTDIQQQQPQQVQFMPNDQYNYILQNGQVLQQQKVAQQQATQNLFNFSENSICNSEAGNQLKAEQCTTSSLPSSSSCSSSSNNTT